MYVFILFFMGMLFLAGSSLFAVETKPWTIMVYLLGDNDLEESAVEDLNEMLAAGTGKMVNLVVLADRGSQYSQADVGGIKSWKTPKLLVPSGKSTYRELADWGKADMGNPSTLSRFIKESMKLYPATNYGLFFWDHGGGWTGFGVDESSGTGLSLRVVDQGIREGLSGSPVTKLNILGFDACLMAAYEAMSVLKNHASWFLASEELEPGHGWDWSVLRELEARPSMDAPALGTLIMKGFMAQAAEQGNQDEVTLSLVDLGGFVALEQALKNFVDQARKDIGNLAPILGRTAGKTLAYGKAGKPEEDSNMIDLGAFVSAAAADIPALKGVRDALLASLNKVVRAKDAGKPLAGSSGISIYFPPRHKFYDPGYDDAGPQVWKTFLSSYYGTASTPGKTDSSGTTTAKPSPGLPRFLVEDNMAEAILEEDGIVLEASLSKESARNIVDSMFSFGIVEDGYTIFLGDSPADLDIETGLVQGYWDRQVLILRKGKQETWGYLSYFGTEDGESQFSIPFAYFKNGKINPETYDYVYMDLTLDSNGDLVSAALYKESDNGMSAELTPVKGSLLVPLLEVVAEDGESTMEMTEDWGFDARDWENIELDYSPLDTGMELYLELSVWDIADNEDWVYWQGTGE